jgi:hypothetical protein
MEMGRKNGTTGRREGGKDTTRIKERKKQKIFLLSSDRSRSGY